MIHARYGARRVLKSRSRLRIAVCLTDEVKVRFISTVSLTAGWWSGTKLQVSKVFAPRGLASLSKGASPPAGRCLPAPTTPNTHDFEVFIRRPSAKNCGADWYKDDKRWSWTARKPAISAASPHPNFLFYKKIGLWWQPHLNASGGMAVRLQPRN